MYVIEWRTVSALARGLFLCSFPDLRTNVGNKHQNDTRVSAETFRHESSYFILVFIGHTDPQMMMKATIPIHRHHFSLPLITFNRWRYNRLLMTSQFPDNYDAITWKVISNSLAIDFIQGDIDGRSRKENRYHPVRLLSGFFHINAHSLFRTVYNFVSHFVQIHCYFAEH